MTGGRDRIRAADASRGAAFMVATMLAFAAMEATGKYLTRDYPVAQVVWARYVFHLLLMLPLIMARGGFTRNLRTGRLGLQLLRSLLLFGMTFLFFTALSHLPMADATAILFLAPLIVTALSVPLLGEAVGPRRWTAVAIGFLGMIVIVRPGAGVIHWAALIQLGTALCYALYQIVTRVLSRSEAPFTTLVYTAAVGAAATSLVAPLQWLTPDLAGWGLLIMTGVLGALGQYLIIQAYQLAPAPALASFGYTHLIWATLLGWLVFRDWPDLWTLAGAALIAGSGLYVYDRERKLKSVSGGGSSP